MRTITIIFKLSLVALFLFLASCDTKRPEEIDVNLLKQPCEYANSISKVFSELNKLKSTANLSEVNFNRELLLKSKLSEIITMADKNRINFFEIIKCPKLEPIRKNSYFGELCLIEGHIQLTKNNIDNSILLFDFARYSLNNSFNNDTKIKVIESIYNLNKENFAESLATLLRNIEFANSISNRSYPDKNPLLSYGHYTSPINTVISRLCSEQVDYESGYFKKVGNGYYLLPISENALNNIFNNVSFNANNFYRILDLSYKQIEEMSSEYFYKCIQNDEDYLNLTTIPQMKDLHHSLQKLDKYEIVNEKENFIKVLLDLRKEYSIAEFKYLTTNFKFTGRAVANESNYSIDKEELEVLVFIENRYYCTLIVPLPVSEVHSFFFKNRLDGVVDFFVSPLKGLNGVSPKHGVGYSYTRIILQDELHITFTTQSKKYEFKTKDQKGKIPWDDYTWKVNESYFNWDEIIKNRLDDNKNLWPRKYYHFVHGIRI